MKGSPHPEAASALSPQAPLSFSSSPDPKFDFLNASNRQCNPTLLSIKSGILSGPESYFIVGQCDFGGAETDIGGTIKNWPSIIMMVAWAVSEGPDITKEPGCYHN